MNQEKEGLQASLDHQEAEHWRSLEKRAAALSGQFATRLLSRFASPELEALIIEQTLSELESGAAACSEQLRAALQQGQGRIVVRTAFDLPEVNKARLLQRLQQCAGREGVAIEYHQQPDLLAGIHLSVGAIQLRASLRSELELLQGATHAA